MDAIHRATALTMRDGLGTVFVYDSDTVTYTPQHKPTTST